MYLVSRARKWAKERGEGGLYQKIEEFSLHILAAILIGNLLTAVAVWYEIYYVVNDSASATVKAILIDAVAAAALGIYIVGTVDAFMVLSKLILEKYLNNRFVAGEAKGRQEATRNGRLGTIVWWKPGNGERILMSHRPYLPTGSSSHRISIASPKL